MFVLRVLRARSWGRLSRDRLDDIRASSPRTVREYLNDPEPERGRRREDLDRSPRAMGHQHRCPTLSPNADVGVKIGFDLQESAMPPTPTFDLAHQPIELALLKRFAESNGGLDTAVSSSCFRDGDVEGAASPAALPRVPE